VWIRTPVGRGSNADDKHSQGEDGEDQLNMLPIDLGAQQGDLDEFVFHDAFLSS
jgi:hypothetical protein